MIRLAEKSDMPELLRMGKAFFDSSSYNQITKFDELSVTAVLNKLIEDKTLLTDGKTALLGFVVFPMFMNVSTVIAQEQFWWVDEDARGNGVGVELLKKAEELAKEYGAKAFSMISLDELNGEKVNKLYLSKGYKRKEQTFLKVL